MIGLGLSITQLAVRQLVGQFNPMKLFALGEQGAWYDPSDLSTLYQDAAGTTAVTAVEQPVGLMLDKSKGLVLGPELVVNGDFSAGTTGWFSYSGATLATENGKLKLTAGAGDATYGAYQSFTTIVGKAYKVTFEAQSTTAIYCRVGATFGSFENANISKTPTTTEIVEFTFFASVTKTFMTLQGTANATSYFDNISVRELPGNHAFQTTATSRPVLSARVNLLTKTEQFDDGVWTKANVTATANKLSETSASGTHSAAQTLTVSAGVQMIASVVVQAAERSFVGLYAGNPGQGTIFNLNTGARHGDLVSAPTAWSINSIGGGLFLCSITYTTASTATAPSVYICNDSGAFSYAGEVGKGLFVSKISLVPANQSSLPYQRVNTATDYDAGPAFPRYLRAYGLDDWMVTGTITPGTDKAQVFAGVRKLSDAAGGSLVEFGIDPGSDSGVFVLDAPPSGLHYGFYSKGSLLSSATTGIGYPAPITNVLTGLGDISGDSTILRVNGTQVATGTADQGIGNFNSHPITLFRRGGTFRPFNGHFYGAVIRFGPNLPIETIQQTEVYMAAKTGITL